MAKHCLRPPRTSTNYGKIAPINAINTGADMNVSLSLKPKIRTRVIPFAALGGLTLLGVGCSANSAGDGSEDAVGTHSEAVVAVNFSNPIAGLSAAELARFNAGVAVFTEVEGPEDGLGPIFNEDSCTTCHSVGGPGGGSTRVETRFVNTVNGVFDPLLSKGGSLIQDHSIGNATCTWIGFDSIPTNANTSSGRRTTPLFGLGLVDATPDSTFQSLAASEAASSPSTAGRVNLVTNLTTNATVVGRFGWKSQVPTLFQFSGDAYLNEMGVTSPQFPVENCPNGDCSLMAACNPRKDLNDDGGDVIAFNDFMSMLAPPPRGPINATVTAGEGVFDSIGCASCHVATLTSGASSIAALANKAYHPYSDFLLHDMGTSGDGIGAMGRATTTEMRTQPLWGLRGVSTFLHAGNAVSISEAIARHRGQANAAATRFNNLSSTQNTQLLAFLNSL
jgi:CxxC motif-containing protein (DUF1111 family)